MIAKLFIDALMTLALLFLMGYQLWGEKAHEYVGTGMFLMFIAHHILNVNRYKRLFKGKYSAMRIVTLCVDILVFLDMLAMMYSGIAMSNHVFAFLSLNADFATARRFHLLGSYWGFLLMSLHLGLHWNIIISAVSKSFHLKPTGRTKTALFLFSAAVAIYGIAAFFKHDFPTYLFLQNEFVFFDFSESKLLFCLDSLAIMELFIFAAHYISKLIRIKSSKRRRINNENHV